MKRFNWQTWSGFLLSVFAFLSYPLLFVRFPLTRDFPWANLLLFGVAVALLVFGVRRAFASDRSHPLRSKIASGVLASLSVVILGLFVFTAFIMSRWLPASHGAPQVGQRAPDFTLADTNGKSVALADLLSLPLDANTGNAGVRGPQPGSPAGVLDPPANPPKGVLLIFYRGYW